MYILYCSAENTGNLKNKLHVKITLTINPISFQINILPGDS